MKTYDIVIPYKNNGDGIELRFALRSIEKYLTYGDIYIISDHLPEWITNVKHHHFLDCIGRKQFSIMQKLWSVYNSGVSKEFIYFNDDHFLLKPLSEIKPWYHGTLSQALAKANGKYYTAVQNTLNHFGDIKNFDIHVPCVFEKEKIHQLYRLEWGDNEYVIKSSYFNDSEGEEMTDCKINIPMTKEGIEERIKDRLFFSVGPNGLKEQMIKKLNELYPDKSRYEL